MGFSESSLNGVTKRCNRFQCLEKGGKSEFEPIRIDPLNCDGFGGPSRAKLTSACDVKSPVIGSDEHHRLNKAK